MIYDIGVQIKRQNLGAPPLTAASCFSLHHLLIHACVYRSNTFLPPNLFTAHLNRLFSNAFLNWQFIFHLFITQRSLSSINHPLIVFTLSKLAGRKKENGAVGSDQKADAGREKQKQWKKLKESLIVRAPNL